MPQVAFEKVRNFVLAFMFEAGAETGFPLAEKLEAAVKSSVTPELHHALPDVLEFFRHEGILDGEERLTARGLEIVRAMHVK